jgi:signal transduction histidine kinase
MRLARFILDNLEAILQEWENFARSLTAASAMTIKELRNDAERMLRFIAADMETEQTRQQEIDKATGHGPALPAGESSAAHEHGTARAVGRFSLVELVSEYRALRASVTRMWIDAVPVTKESVAQIMRFNEAIDQILAEGVATFTEHLDHEADLFTASIGHDLSNPVDAVMMSTRRLRSSTSLTANERAAVERIERASERLSGMLTDLRDFTRTRLGGLLVVHAERADVAALVRNVVSELEPAYPDRTVVVDCRGDLSATVDPKRISQLLSNLVANALQHGGVNTDVQVTIQREGEHLTIDVRNEGRTIEAGMMKRLFDPLSSRGAHGDNKHLGLGLYIAQQIALAHRGSIAVQSSGELGTCFTVRLPVQTDDVAGVT